MIHSNNFHEPTPSGDRRARAAELRDEQRLTREGVELLGHGAMICPGCSAPIVLTAPAPVQVPLDCGFCGHSGPARDYLARDVFDTVSNEVYMVARIAARVA